MIQYVPLLILFVVAGCSVLPPAGASPTPEATPALGGRTFLSTSVTLDGAGVALVPGTRIRLSFEPADLGADAGCNLLGGRYAVVDGVLEVGQMHTTEMGCDAARHAQDEWLAEFLGSRPLVVLDGNELRLESGSSVVNLLDREMAEPDRPLLGTTWVLDSIISGDAVSSLPAGVRASLSIAQDGQVALEAGCNQGTARAEVGEATIEFGPIGLTRMACPGSRDEVERRVLAVLSAGPLSYEIEAGSLTLSAAEVGLIFRAGN
ncbi:MAG TPA: META domain-containing protein [Candidatus Limnocylindria bacterium]|nr:META domain-containing protein [Candidatus Limnocylindria bacterium]